MAFGAFSSPEARARRSSPPPPPAAAGLTRETRLALLEPLLARRILVLDGAMGTMIQTYGLGERDYRGERFADWPRDLKGNSDLLTLTQPEIIRAIHSRLPRGRRRHHRDQLVHLERHRRWRTTAWRSWSTS